jgi:hypothetical protein
MEECRERARESLFSEELSAADIVGSWTAVALAYLLKRMPWAPGATGRDHSEG